jgi:hypothetical protein
MTEIQEVELKNGQKKHFMKDGDRNVIMDKPKLLSKLQLYLLIFILILSILMTAVLMAFITNGFNQIIGGIQIMDQHILALLNNQTARLIPHQ